MMHSIRKYTKTILWIVVLAFVGTIFFVWGMDLGRRKEYLEKGSAAVVDNQAISYDEFGRIWEQQSRQLYEMNKEEPPREKINQLRNELINVLIDRLLLEQAYQKLGLKIFAEEVAARIMGMQTFQQEGKFSQEKYFQILNYLRISPEEFEADQKHALASLKMTQMLRDTVAVTETEVKNYFQARSRLLKLGVVAFNWKEQMNQIRVEESEMQDYYQKHREEYDQPEEVRAAHILVGLKPKASDEDKLTAKLKLENLRNDIVKGADFGAMAQQYSDDTGSKIKGGDLGFFRHGQMVPAFEKAAFSLKIGELSQPVESPYGYHLIEVTERREAKRSRFENVRAKILNILKEKAAKQETFQAANQFMERLKKTKSLEPAAQNAKVKIIVTDWLKEDASLPGISNSGEIMDQAFDLALNQPSNLLQAGDMLCFVEVKAEKFQPFNAQLYNLEKDFLTEKLKMIRGDQAVRDWLEAARQKAKIINNIAKEANENKTETPDPAEKAPTQAAPGNTLTGRHP